MYIAIPQEITPCEHRVALVPPVLPLLTELDCTILYETGAGKGAHYSDQSYSDKGAHNTERAQLYAKADVIVKIQPPTKEEVALMKDGAVLVGLLAPTSHIEVLQAMQKKDITSFAVEYFPRISRAQAMDVLSSQATITGYKAVLLAAQSAPRFFPMLTTAAGTIRPTQVLVIGAGVAGLQAIATARRLGAVVYAYDVRVAAREQVESLGAKMVQIDLKAESSGGYARALTAAEKAQQEAVLFEAVKKAESIISTALIPEKPAPVLITKEMVESMTAGSVIVDVAAVAGGNCALTKAGETIWHKEICIHGPLNLPSTMARDASDMYAKNLIHFLKLIIKDKTIQLDWEDPILAQSVLTHAGEIKHPSVLRMIEGANT